MPAKNDNAVIQLHRSAWFAGKPGSYRAGLSAAPDTLRSRGLGKDRIDGGADFLDTPKRTFVAGDPGAPAVPKGNTPTLALEYLAIDVGRFGAACGDRPEKGLSEIQQL